MTKTIKTIKLTELQVHLLREFVFLGRLKEEGRHDPYKGQVLSSLKSLERKLA
jgi:hypothetical protein